MIPRNQVLILRTDGAARGNPGHAAAGVVIEDAQGKLLARGKKYLGRLTNRNKTTRKHHGIRPNSTGDMNNMY